MKVVFDAGSIMNLGPTLGRTGVGRWTAETIKALATLNPDWDFIAVLFSYGPVNLDVSTLGDNVSYRQVRLPAKVFHLLRAYDRLPSVEHFVGECDLMLGTNFIAWSTKRAARIPVVYDLSFIKYPETVSPRNRMILRAGVPRTVRSSHRVITISEAMREEIIQSYGVDEHKVQVVYPGSSLDTDHLDGALPEGIPADYILTVGTVEPRKNLLRLIEAHSGLRAEDPKIPPLVMVGGLGWLMDSARPLLEQQIAKGNLHMLGYIEDKVLAGLYRNAKMLVFPSLYEGFGLPALEAMSLGCPVLLSDRTSLPEVGGESAEYFDPTDPADIARCIKLVMGDDRRREAMGRSGIERSKMFSWAKGASQITDLIEEVMTTRKQK